MAASAAEGAAEREYGEGVPGARAATALRRNLFLRGGGGGIRAYCVDAFNRPARKASDSNVDSLAPVPLFFLLLFCVEKAFLVLLIFTVPHPQNLARR